MSYSKVFGQLVFAAAVTAGGAGCVMGTDAPKTPHVSNDGIPSTPKEYIPWRAQRFNAYFAVLACALTTKTPTAMISKINNADGESFIDCMNDMTFKLYTVAPFDTRIMAEILEIGRRKYQIQSESPSRQSERPPITDNLVSNAPAVRLG